MKANAKADGKAVSPTPAVLGPTLAELVAEEADADVYLFAGGMYFPSDREFSQCVRDNKTRKNALLYLSTFGGSADTAYRVARCLQAAYTGKISLLVVEFCKSAGTLLAIGASELVMGDTAELGPLDVQIAKHDTLLERTSGLTPIQSLTTLREETFKYFEKCFVDVVRRSGGRISTRSASHAAVRMTVGLFRPIFGQLDPMKLAEYGRSLLVADDYGQRLNRRFKNLKADALTQLVAGYPSHEFVIDKAEAETLFSAVRSPTELEAALATFLLKEVWDNLSDPEGRRRARVRCLTRVPERPVEKEADDDAVRVTGRVAPPAAGRKPGPAASEGRADVRPPRKPRRPRARLPRPADGNGVSE